MGVRSSEVGSKGCDRAAVAVLRLLESGAFAKGVGRVVGRSR